MVEVADRRVVAEQHGQEAGPAAAEAHSATNERRQVDSRAREQDLLHRARAENVFHWQQHQRPISAETLRKRLHVGTGTARSLVAQLRSETKATFRTSAPEPAAGGAG